MATRAAAKAATKAPTMKIYRAVDGVIDAPEMGDPSILPMSQETMAGFGRLVDVGDLARRRGRDGLRLLPAHLLRPPYVFQLLVDAIHVVRRRARAVAVALAWRRAILLVELELVV